MKITWVQQRQYHRAQESAKERMLSLALRRTVGYHVQKLRSRREWSSGSRQELPRQHEFPNFRSLRFRVNDGLLYIDKGPLGFNFVKIDWSVQIFTILTFLKICSKLSNFDLSNSNFVPECTNTK